jgi:hypothetical protein
MKIICGIVYLIGYFILLNLPGIWLGIAPVIYFITGSPDCFGLAFFFGIFWVLWIAVSFVISTAATVSMMQGKDF